MLGAFGAPLGHAAGPHEGLSELDLMPAGFSVSVFRWKDTIYWQSDLVELQFTQ